MLGGRIFPVMHAYMFGNAKLGSVKLQDDAQGYKTGSVRKVLGELADCTLLPTKKP